MTSDWSKEFVERSREAFVVTDSDGIVVDWSPGANMLFGWTEEEVVGKQLISLIIDEQERDLLQECVSDIHKNASALSSTEPLQFISLTKSRQKIPIDFRITPLFNDSTRRFVVHIRAIEIQPTMLHEMETRSADLNLQSLDRVTRKTLTYICQKFNWAAARALRVDMNRAQLSSTGIWHSELENFEIPQQAVDQSTFIDEELVQGAWKTQSPQWRELRHANDETHPFVSELAVPLLVDRHVVAVLQFLDIERRLPNHWIESRIAHLSRELTLALEMQNWQRERLFLAEIVESSPDAVIGKDLHGRILSWNQGAERVYGYTQQEAIGGSISMILPDGVFEEERDIMEAVTSGKRLLAFETVRKHKSGRLVDVSLTSSPIRDQQGLLIGSATIERDITLQTKSLRDLRDREEKLRMLMEASGEAMYGIDTDGLCTFANRACAHLLGYSSSMELLKQDMHRLIHHSRQDGSRYADECCPIYQTLHRGISTHVANEVLWRKDGTCFPVEYWASPIRRGDEIVGAVVVFEDSTERLQAFRTKAELAAIVESSHDAIIGKEIDGTIKSWNQAAEKLYGYSAEAALGRNYSDLLGAEEHEISSGEFQRRHKRGYVIDVGITESPIRNALGEIVGTASVERDITQRKRREHELEVARHHAELANQAKSEFLANISHELRTPMNGVLGMLRISLDEQLPSGLKNYLTTARESAEMLLILLDDLLDLSRLEAGQFELDPEPFSVRDTVDKAVKTVALRAHEKGLELIVQIDSSVPERLDGDDLRLRQILTNLTGNAVKFTDQGEVVISVSGTPLSNGQYRLECSVKDTGIGITEEAQRKIFEPFTQADSSVTRNRSGSGLGLAICSELIELMDGHIFVESELGHGTIFRFDVLLHQTNSLESETDTKQLAGELALVVDDNKNHLQMMSQILQDFQMRVKVASNAHSAMNVVDETTTSEESIAVAIIDSRMPDIDGVALVNQFRQRGFESPIILMVSTGEGLSMSRKIEQQRIESLLEKPVSRSDVFDALMTALNGPHLSSNKFDEVTETPLRRLNVLVAEDTLANQKVVQAILEKRGHTVEVAHNGQEAISKIQPDKFDVVLMDVQMPVMDGLQATTAIRQTQGIDDLPIIALTAHARREDRRRCLAAGMDGYLSKPLDAQKLIRMVEKLGQGTSNCASESIDLENLEVARERSTPASTEPPVLNLEIALKRLGGDHEIIRELARIFIVDAPVLVREIQLANETQDFNACMRAAHSLRGLAGNFEARQLSAAAQAIETAAKANRSIPQELSDALIKQFQRTLAEITNIAR